MKIIKTKKIPAIVVFIVGIFSLGYSAVRGPNYYDVRSLGMGNTTVAITTDRTAIFHNPAGLSLIKEKIDISFSPFSMAIVGKFFKLLSSLKEHGGKLTELNKMNDDEIKELVEIFDEYDGEWVGIEYIPEITVATKNLGFGMYCVFPVGLRIESSHFIPKIAVRGQRDVVFTWAVGVPLRSENSHCGISIEYIQRTTLDERITTYTETYLLFNDIRKRPLGVIGDYSDIQHGASFDVGFMHDFNGFRLAYDVKDILGIIGGEIVTPPQLDLGCAYFFPQMEKVEFIENLIVSIEFSNIFGLEPATEKYENFWKKTHLGAEIDFDYCALRLGANQGYITAGLGIKAGVFKADYAFFTEETGYYPGQMPNRKHVLNLGFNIKIKSQKEEDTREDIKEVSFIDDK